MTEALAIAQLVILLLPVVTQVVQWIEDEVNQAKTTGTVSTVTGSDKQAAATVLLNQLWPTLATTGTGAKIVSTLQPAQITTAMTTLINSVVAALNALGIFKASAPAAPAA